MPCVTHGYCPEQCNSKSLGWGEGKLLRLIRWVWPATWSGHPFSPLWYGRCGWIGCRKSHGTWPPPCMWGRWRCRVCWSLAWAGLPAEAPNRASWNSSSCGRLRSWASGGGSEVELAASPHLNPPHPIPSLGPHRTNLRGEGFQGFLSLKAF